MPAAGPSPRSFASLILAAVLLPAAPGPASAQTLEPISYTVRFPAPATHYAEIAAEVPADGRTHARADDGDVDARLLSDPRVRPARRGSARRHAGGRTSRGRQVEQEPLAHRDGRRGPGHGGLPGLLPRDERPHELDRGGLRDAQRRPDVPDPHRARAAASRRPHRAAAGVERERDGAAAGAGRPPAQLSGSGLRHAGRCTDPRRQPDHLSLHRGGHAPCPGQHRRGRGLGRSDLGHRCRAHRARAAPDLGFLPLRAIPLPEHAGRGGRRARAQGFDPADDQPLDHPRPPPVPALAGDGQPRAVPRLERQAAAAGRPRPLRLRAAKRSLRASGWWRA